MATNIKRHVSHIKSSVVTDGQPRLPLPSNLVEGEIAVNYAKDYETLSIKNSSGYIATFSSDTIRDAKLEEVGRTISAALNELNETKADRADLYN